MDIRLASDLLAAKKKEKAVREAAEALRQSEHEQQAQRDRERLVAQREEQLASIGFGLRMSYAAYIDEAATKTYLSESGFDKYERITTWFGAEGFCCLRERRAFLCFAGTDSLIDGLVDLLGCVPWHRPPVHSGFGGSWHALKNKRIAAWLNENQDEFDDISLYGHSLGGAISHVAALDLASQYTVREVISFGAPRSGFLGTAEMYDLRLSQGCDKTLREKTFRVVHGSDLVSRVPLETMGYRHVGRLAYLSYGGSVYLDEEAEQKRKNESLWGQIGSLFDTFLGLERNQSNVPHIVTSNPSMGAPYKASLLDHLWRLIGFADKIFPYVKSMALALVSLFVPIAAFLAGVSDAAQSSFAHLLRRYFHYFPEDDIRQELVATPPSVLGRLKSGAMLVIKMGLLLGAIAGVLYGVYWISLHTFIPGLKSVPSWFG